MTQRELGRESRKDTDRTGAQGAARGSSPDAGHVAIGAGQVASPQAALILQRRLGNAAYGQALERQGQRHEAARGHGVQRAVVVQRMGEEARQRAEENLRAGGWEPDETGYGYTRAPQPEAPAQPAHEAQAPAAASASAVTLPAAGEGDRMTMYVHAKKKASFRDPEYFNNVGHSWVSFNRNGKFDSSAGFYPTNGMLDPENPLHSVPGGVRLNYDSPEGATTTMSVELTAKQYDKAREYVESHAHRDYNLGRYNCTDFAAGVYKAATGRSLPGGNNLLMPNNPNDLHAGMKKHNLEHAGQGR